MRLPCRSLTMILAAAALCTLHPAHADYPNNVLNMVVPFAAGDPSDHVARSLAEAMRPALGKNIIIENKAGHAGVIGTTFVARTAPNGYTILFTHAGFTAAPALYSNPGYDALKSFEPIGLVVDMPMMIVARDNFPPNNIQELTAYVKAHKAKITLAHAGFGTSSHLCGTMLEEALGVRLQSVPYKNIAPAMNDLLDKRVDILCDQTRHITPLSTKRIKAYAVSSMKRVPTLPTLPTLHESGYKGFNMGIWHGMWVPKGTPQPVKDKLNNSLQAGLQDAQFQKRMQTIGATVLTEEATPQALAKRVKQQVQQWQTLFQKAGIEKQALKSVPLYTTQGFLNIARAP